MKEVLAERKEKAQKSFRRAFADTGVYMRAKVSQVGLRGRLLSVPEVWRTRVATVKDS